MRIRAHNDTSQTSRFDRFCATITIPSFQFITLECSCHAHSHSKSLLSIALRGSTYRRVVTENARFFCRAAGTTLTNPGLWRQGPTQDWFLKNCEAGHTAGEFTSNANGRESKVFGPIPGALCQAFSVWATLSFLSYSSIMLPPTASSKTSTWVVANFLALTPRSNKRSSSANVRP